ncbi:MAG: SPOR domain-containing protein [Rhodobacter sp.]|nr:SPOR domain-containing protein [Paracoccaceae bacterium]MCC0080619.1 SPOR domain-containing protein [Rhodobacter sp.]
MAQWHYEAYHAPQAAPVPQRDPRRGGVGRLVNLAGAALSVALVVGVGVWSYRLMVRDVTGVPVIRAMSGPIRTSPEDPGGRQAAYQGLAVNSVAAEGGAANAAQIIALAPPPVELTDEDRSAAVLAARTGSIAAPQPVQPGGAIGTPQSVQIASVPAEQPAPLTGLQIVPASLPGVSRSPIPRARPAGTGFQSAPQAATQRVASAATSGTGSDPQAEALLQELVTRLGSPRVTEIDPASLTPGTRLVQLGAYDDEPAARAAWDDLAARFPAYLDGRGRIVEAASAGGRTFYRLRAAGFSDEPEARRFCSIFQAENVDCIPVLIR